MPEGEPVPEAPAPADAVSGQEAPASKEATDAPADDKVLTESVGASEGVDAEGISKLAGATGGDSTLTIALALIAVVGAGTTWKFLTQFSEQKHEQRMKQLDIEAQAQGNGAAQPPPCQAATLKLEAEIAELKTRLCAVEKKSMSLSADFDGEDVERQLKKLQKTVKAMQEAHDAR